MMSSQVQNLTNQVKTQQPTPHVVQNNENLQHNCRDDRQGRSRQDVSRHTDWDNAQNKNRQEGIAKNNTGEEGEDNLNKPRQKTGEHLWNSKGHDEEVQSSYNGAKKHKSYHLSEKETDSHYKNYAELKEMMGEWDKIKS